MIMKRMSIATAGMLIMTMVTTVRTQTSANCYPDPPKILSGEVDRAVVSILQNDARAILLSMPDLIAYTIADVVSSTKVREMELYQYYGDVLRTDQQVGASSTSSGSTSAVEKPGLIELIGFAVERGAIQQSVNDSTVTLTTSPYALVAAVQGDSPDTYRENALLTRLGVSATFLLNDNKIVADSLSRKQLTEWSAKLRLTGDRSTRSNSFQLFWKSRVGDLQRKRLDILGGMETEILNIPAIVERFAVRGSLDVVTPLQNNITAFLNANHIVGIPGQTVFPAAQTQPIRDMILCTLFNEVHEPVRTEKIKVDPAEFSRALTQLAEVQKLIAIAQSKFQDDLKEWVKKGTVSTLGYTNHRVAEGSDYSEFKLLFERHVAPLDVVLNAAFSIYNKPDPAKHQERLRDFSIAGSLEWASKSNPLFRGDEKMATPITFSLNGRFERLKENESMAMREPDIGSFQARLEIPVAPGFSIPIAYTYATATEMMPKPENRFNVGFHVDVNKILSFKKATQTQ